ADSKSRAREWLPKYQIIRDSKLKACLAYLILEQISQRFDNLLEIYTVRKSSHIVVRLDHCGLSAQTAVHSIQINSSLNQIIHRTDFLRFLFKDTDKFLTNDFTLSLRIFHTF